MNYFLNLLFSGIAVGALYGLIAMGFAMIYKVSRVVNFAQGEVMMLIAYIAYSAAKFSDGSVPAVAATSSSRPLPSAPCWSGSSCGPCWDSRSSRL